MRERLDSCHVVLVMYEGETGLMSCCTSNV